MLGLLLIVAWITFVAGYLIWQQLSGDLAHEPGSHQRDGAIGRKPSAISFECAAEAPIAAREDLSDSRRSLVYRPIGFSASAGGSAAES